MRRTSSNVHHGAQVVETNVVGGTAARLRATSHCTIEIRPPRRAAPGRRRGGAAARWSRRRAATPGPGRADPRPGGRSAAPARRPRPPARRSDPSRRTVAPERRRPLRVPLDGDDLDAPPGQRVRAGATAGTDLDDQLAGREGSLPRRRTRRRQEGGSSGRDGDVARPGLSVGDRRPRTRTITALPMTTSLPPDPSGAVTSPPAAATTSASAPAGRPVRAPAPRRTTAGDRRPSPCARPPRPGS